MSSSRLRTALACATALIGVAVADPSQAAVTLLGTLAAQSKVPAKLASCSAVVDGDGFTPHLEFVQQADPVARYTVIFAFFDKKNVSVGLVDVSDHGASDYALPAGADSLTCAIKRLTLDDGTAYPSAGGGNASAGGVIAGAVGLGAALGIALAASHSGSSNTTAAPTPTPTPTSSGASPSPSATASGATPTPTGTVGPTPFPTAPTTPIPTLRPHLVAPSPRPASTGRPRGGAGF